MLTPDEVRALVERMEALSAELIDPLICRTPGYGAPGHAHCAACCYGRGYVVTCDEEQAVYEAVIALDKAARMIREGAGMAPRDPLSEPTTRSS